MMVHPLTDHDPLVQEIVNASGNKIPIFVEGEPKKGEEIEYGRWCGNSPVRFFGRDGKESLFKDLEFMEGRINQIFAIVDRDLALPEEIEKTLDSKYDGRLYYLPCYDLECFYVDPSAVWHCIKQSHFRDLDSFDPQWRDIDGIRSQIAKIAEEAIPQTAGNIVLRQARKEGFKDFNSIDPFLSEEEVIDQLKICFSDRQDWVKEKFSGSINYVRSFFPDKYFKIISGKKFLVKALFKRLQEKNIKILQDTFFNISSYYLNENPPQDFIDLIEKTILPRARKLAMNSN